MRLSHMNSLPLLLRATEYDPNWVLPFNELGKNYVKLNDHTHAAEAYRRAIAIDPNWVFPQLNLGGVYLHKKQWDLAEQSYLKSIQLDPTLATPWYFLWGRFVLRPHAFRNLRRSGWEILLDSSPARGRISATRGCRLAF